jgi:hypothetical protein
MPRAKLLFLGLADKALELTDGVLPEGMSFPSERLNAPLDDALTTCTKTTRVIEAMVATADDKLLAVDLHRLTELDNIRYLISVYQMQCQLRVLQTQSWRNENHLDYEIAKFEQRLCSRQAEKARKAEKRLNDEYMVSISLKEDVRLIQEMRALRKFEHEQKELFATWHKRVKEIEFEDEDTDMKKAEEKIEMILVQVRQALAELDLVSSVANMSPTLQRAIKTVKALVGLRSCTNGEDPQLIS